MQSIYSNCLTIFLRKKTLKSFDMGISIIFPYVWLVTAPDPQMEGRSYGKFTIEDLFPSKSYWIPRFNKAV